MMAFIATIEVPRKKKGAIKKMGDLAKSVLEEFSDIVDFVAQTGTLSNCPKTVVARDTKYRIKNIFL